MIILLSKPVFCDIAHCLVRNTKVQPKTKRRVKGFLATELILSKAMQTRCHSEELSEQNLILERVVKFCSLGL